MLKTKKDFLKIISIRYTLPWDKTSNKTVSFKRLQNNAYEGHLHTLVWAFTLPIASRLTVKIRLLPNPRCLMIY